MPISFALAGIKRKVEATIFEDETPRSAHRFMRVDPGSIVIGKAELADNSWQALREKGHTYADKAQERLGPVKGKNFRKEMTKAKRGTYRGGAIDTQAVNSIRFDD